MRDRYDSEAIAGTIDVPVLLVIAEHDEIVPPSHSRDLASAFDEGVARVETIAGTGHNTIGSSPDYGRGRRALVGARTA